MKKKKQYIKELMEEIKSNSYRADNHEGNEIVIRESRVAEIIGERALAVQGKGDIKA